MTAAVCSCSSLTCSWVNDAMLNCLKEERRVCGRADLVLRCSALTFTPHQIQHSSMDGSESDDRTSSTSTSNYGYNVASTLAPSQRDLRIQAARRNVAEHQAAATAGNVTATDEDSNNSGAEARQREQSTRGKRSDLARLVTERTNLQQSTHKESAQTASKNASDAIFAQLQVIQTLQASDSRIIATIHFIGLIRHTPGRDNP